MSKVILPAACTTTDHAGHLTNRYRHVPTKQIIDLMAEEGFVVAGASSRAARGPGAVYGKHMVDFRLPDAQEIEGCVPRILFINSHDGSTSARTVAGLIRFVCSNGLVVGSNVVENSRTRHIGDDAANLIDRMKRLAKNTAPMFEQIERWSKTELTEAKMRDFALFASTMRWDDPNRFSADDLLKVRRPEDEGRSLWRVFNRVQENIVQGGLTGILPTGRQTTTRPLLEVGANVQFNAELWALAEEFAG